MRERLRSVGATIIAVALVGATLGVLGSAVVSPAPAYAAREYDIGDGDILIMYTPTEVRQLLAMLTVPGYTCGPIPGVAGGTLKYLAGKLITTVARVSKVCSVYAATRLLEGFQVRAMLQSAASQGKCLPLVVDTASWRSPKLRPATTGTGLASAGVALNTVEQFKNRGDSSHPTISIRCTDYQPRLQVPLVEQINQIQDPGAAPLAPADDGQQERDQRLFDTHQDTPSESDSPSPPPECSGGPITCANDTTS